MGPVVPVPDGGGWLHPTRSAGNALWENRFPLAEHAARFVRSPVASLLPDTVLAGEWRGCNYAARKVRVVQG